MNIHCSEDVTTLIEYPCLLFGLVGIPGIVFYFVFYVKSKNGNFLNAFQAIPDAAQIQTPGKFYLFLMFLFLLQGQGYPAGFSGLLTTYGMSQNLSISVMSSMTSFYWLTLTIGRVLPAFLPESFDQKYVALSTLFGNFIGVILLSVSVFQKEVFLWSCCFFLGLFTGPCLSVGLTWSGQVIELTPNIKALYMTASSCGFMFPYICGSLMNNFGDSWFIYFFLGFYIVTVWVYICVNITIMLQRKKINKGAVELKWERNVKRHSHSSSTVLCMLVFSKPNEALVARSDDDIVFPSTQNGSWRPNAALKSTSGGKAMWVVDVDQFFFFLFFFVHQFGDARDHGYRDEWQSGIRGNRIRTHKKWNPDSPTVCNAVVSCAKCISYLRYENKHVETSWSDKCVYFIQQIPKQNIFILPLTHLFSE